MLLFSSLQHERGFVCRLVACFWNTVNLWRNRINFLPIGVISHAKDEDFIDAAERDLSKSDAPDGWNESGVVMSTGRSGTPEAVTRNGVFHSWLWSSSCASSCRYACGVRVFCRLLLWSFVKVSVCVSSIYSSAAVTDLHSLRLFTDLAARSRRRFSRCLFRS